jgi:hypothetical protein
MPTNMLGQGSSKLTNNQSCPGPFINLGKPMRLTKRPKGLVEGMMPSSKSGLNQSLGIGHGCKDARICLGVASAICTFTYLELPLLEEASIPVAVVLSKFYPNY